LSVYTDKPELVVIAAEVHRPEVLAQTLTLTDEPRVPPTSLMYPVGQKPSPYSNL